MKMQPSKEADTAQPSAKKGLAKTFNHKVKKLNEYLTSRGLEVVIKVHFETWGTPNAQYHGRPIKDFCNCVLIANVGGELIVGLGTSKRSPSDVPSRRIGMNYAFGRAKQSLIRALLAVREKKSPGFLESLRQIRKDQAALKRASRLSTRSTSSSIRKEIRKGMGLNGSTSHATESARV